MKRAGVLVTICLWIGVVGLGGWSQCCDCGRAEVPSCYESFGTNEVIGISLIVPVDYFVCHNTTESPRILGWRVETWDGMVVRAEFFPDGPYSRLHTIEWDLSDSTGGRVAPGYYRIVVETTDAGDIAHPVQIVERCRPCYGCFCWPTCSVCCTTRCRVPYGEPYLSLFVADTQACGLTISVHVELDCPCP